MKLRCDLSVYRVAPGRKVNLAHRPTLAKPLYASTKAYRALLEEGREELSRLQSVLYAHDRYALLLIFQGMDTAGKDGAIKHVMSGVNPQGCQVFSFKTPSEEELDHNFLWRTNARLPERGRIGIFNRSYYEEVLVVRVLPEVLARQRLPEELVRPKRIWRERFRDIVHMEKHLHRNGTRILKFFLHVSREEQRRRFLDRIDDPESTWKFSPGDLAMRGRWDDFQRAYADCLAATSTQFAPWYVIPADDKKNARLIISHVVIETLKGIPMRYPRLTGEQRRAVNTARAALLAEKP